MNNDSTQAVKARVRTATPTECAGVLVAEEPTSGARGQHELLGGILVCGGRSRRMGRDKARLVVHGQPLLERTAAVLGRLCGDVVLACGTQERYTELGLPLALDRVENGGPLAGVIAGLETLGTPHAVALACDMPRVGSELLDSLFEHAREHKLDVCFLATEGGMEPLCAIYSATALPAMRAAMEQGWRRVTSFLEVEGLGTELRTGHLLLENLPLDSQSACNLNTPEDLEREQKEIAP